jgi:hypothetical protein
MLRHRNFAKSKENFEQQYVTFAMLLLNIIYIYISCLIREKNKFRPRNCWPPILEATYNNNFFLIHLEKTVPVQIYFCMAIGFECFTGMSVEDFDTPL